MAPTALDSRRLRGGGGVWGLVRHSARSGLGSLGVGKPWETCRQRVCEAVREGPGGRSRRSSAGEALGGRGQGPSQGLGGA